MHRSISLNDASFKEEKTTHRKGVGAIMFAEADSSDGFVDGPRQTRALPRMKDVRRSLPGLRDIPPPARWTAIAAVYYGRTVVVNFRDPSVTDQLRCFVQVCGLVQARSGCMYLFFSSLARHLYELCGSESSTCLLVGCLCFRLKIQSGSPSPYPSHRAT